MELFITGDYHWESGVEKILDEFYDQGFNNILINKNYGNSLKGISLLLMCQDPSLNLKQRVIYSKKEKEIYIDVMLNLYELKEISVEEKKKIVKKKILNEIRSVIEKYNFNNFNLEEFIYDLKEWFIKF